MSTTDKGVCRSNLIHVLQGEVKTTNDPSAVMTTVLGSCVATCLYDPVRGIGGMNHFLLAESDDGDRTSSRYGVNLMEQLINHLLQRGAVKSELKAKLFGGGNVLRGQSGIGSRNAAFAQKFLADEGIECAAKSLGGAQARRLRFWPTSGRVSQQLVRPTEFDDGIRVPRRPVADEGGDVELFGG